VRRWIASFENKHPDQVLCPGFDRVRYLAKCPHACSYCFVEGTFSRFGRPRDITEADLPEMERAVERWMARRDCPKCLGSGKTAPLTETKMLSHVYCHACRGTGRVSKLLNAGELSDSFAPDICAQASLRLIEVFRRQDRHTLLLLTKARPMVLFDVEPTPQVVVSFSLGQRTYLGRDLAPGASEAASVLESAVRLLQAGWRVRLRIDPLITGTGVWKVVTLLKPVLVRWERITLGTLRFTRSGYRAVAHGSPFQAALAARVALEEGEAGMHPYRLPLAQRTALYAAVLAQLQDYSDGWALCKETEACWQAVMGEAPQVPRCNCVL